MSLGAGSGGSEFSNAHARPSVSLSLPVDQAVALSYCSSTYLLATMLPARMIMNQPSETVSKSTRNVFFLGGEGGVV